MANKSLFGSSGRRGAAVLEKPDTRNEAGGRAFSLPARAALAQYICTSTLNSSYYSNDQEQLDAILKLCDDPSVDALFIAKTAVYARQHGLMKDAPNLLLAILSRKNSVLFRKAFSRVVDNGQMLKAFVKIIRSGQAGRKSLGTAPRAMIDQWLNGATDWNLLAASVGQDPSIADVIKLARPKGTTPARQFLYRYLIGKPVDDTFERYLPENVRAYEAWKAATEKSSVPNVPFQLLTAAEPGDEAWTEMAKGMTWSQLRLNLNTLKRHHVLDNPEMVSFVAQKLRDPEQIKRAKVQPYQLFAAFGATASETGEKAMPSDILNALAEATDIALGNVPEIRGKAYVMLDVSGSMSGILTGDRGRGATSKIRVVDAAALIAAAVQRANPSAEILPFDTKVHTGFEPTGHVLQDAMTLAKYGGGGTNCALPLAELNRRGAKGELVFYASDNESWVDSGPSFSYHSTGVLEEWTKFKARNPKAKMVNVNLQASGTSQIRDELDIANLGGWSDATFSFVSSFVEQGTEGAKHWVDTIDQVTI